MSDQTDENMSYGIMAFLLVIVWMLSNFTTFLCMIIIVLVLIIANIAKDDTNRKIINESDDNLQRKAGMESSDTVVKSNASRQSLPLLSGKLTVDSLPTEKTVINLLDIPLFIEKSLANIILLFACLYLRTAMISLIYG